MKTAILSLAVLVAALAIFMLQRHKLSSLDSEHQELLAGHSEVIPSPASHAQTITKTPRTLDSGSIDRARDLMAELVAALTGPRTDPEMIIPDHE
jgi:hypothetical protein